MDERPTRPDASTTEPWPADTPAQPPAPDATESTAQPPAPDPPESTAPPPPVRPAERLDRGPLVAGVVLVVVGLAFLAGRFVTIELGVETWPLWIVVPGVAMLIGSLFIPDRGGVGLAIPGGIVTMVGLVLWVQSATDLYATWAYAWALVAPGGVGVGMFLFGLFRGYRDIVANGLRTILVAIGLFLGFAFFFEAVIGLSGNRIADLDTVLPAALVVLGVVVLVMAFVPRRHSASG
ncbi:MAG TPA: hypothetical protein VFK54_09560 [Candidatus Limnocylindrales bacterium]|nr:hypothetical protein [Candidatus Limnocylindrales bacterium]